MKMKFITFSLLAWLAAAQSARPVTVDLEDRTLAPNSFDNGSDGTGGFNSRGAFFNNSYDPQFQSWIGWSYSDVVDTTTAGYGNQYASYAGGGSAADGSTVVGGNYAVGFDGGYINMPGGTTPQSVRLTNTTYAALSMKNGDQFAKKFGGASGNDPDFFDVTLTGYALPGGAAGGGGATGSITFYLADYRFSDNSQDYIVNSWQQVDLTALGAAQSVGISFDSSDKSTFGNQTFINTPTYVALDNLVTVPEPGGVLLLALSFVGRRRRK